MNRRHAAALSTGSLLPMSLALPAQPAHADTSHPQLASYCARHAAAIQDTAYGWNDASPPRALPQGIVQVAVTQTAWCGITSAGYLKRLT